MTPRPTLLRLRLAATVPLLAMMIAASHAPASDGRIEINDVSAAAGDVTGTGNDAPGYPVSLDFPGSYVLTSDLNVLGDTDAIEVTTSGVNIDLAGFSIIGPINCSAPPPPISCGGGSGRGIATSQPGVKVHGGQVHGFAGHGLELGDGAVVESVHANGNGGSGIVIGASGSIRDCSAIGNGSSGVIAGTDSLVRGCNLTSNNDFGADLDPGAGFGWNVLSDNGIDPIDGGQDLSHNLCNGSTNCVPSSPEVCDGLDNDFDGMVDEDLTPPPCADQLGVCAGSTQSCAGIAGFLTCGAGEFGLLYESFETTCDGLDNDCDGLTDNGLSAPLCLHQLGVCAGTRQTCAAGDGFQPCGVAEYGPSYQAVETLCDNLDNDCDGLVDEGFEETGSVCQVGIGACAAQGFVVCDGGGTSTMCSASPGVPSEEICNGVDDDCNGIVDDSIVLPLCPMQDGVCNGSTQACGGVSGLLTCNAGSYGPNYEIDEVSCDGLDNDCDTVMDEGC